MVRRAGRSEVQQGRSREDGRERRRRGLPGCWRTSWGELPKLAHGVPGAVPLEKYLHELD